MKWDESDDVKRAMILTFLMATPEEPPRSLRAWIAVMDMERYFDMIVRAG
jgi:hypothetical protein